VDVRSGQAGGFNRIDDPFATSVGTIALTRCCKAVSKVIPNDTSIPTTIAKSITTTKFSRRMITLNTNLLTLLLQMPPGPSLGELYQWGGAPFMHPLTLLFVADLAVLAYVVVKYVLNKHIPAGPLESIKQIGTLALAWGILSSLVGLFQAFEALEASQEIIPFQVIMGGMKVSLITVIYGLIVYCISLIGYITLTLMNRKESVA
jgi:hypothetical protein